MAHVRWRCGGNRIPRLSSSLGPPPPHTHSIGAARRLVASSPIVGQRRLASAMPAAPMVARHAALVGTAAAKRALLRTVHPRHIHTAPFPGRSCYSSSARGLSRPVAAAAAAPPLFRHRASPTTARRWLCSPAASSPKPASSTASAIGAFEKAMSSSSGSGSSLGGGDGEQKIVINEPGFFGNESHMWEKDIRSTSGDVEDPKLVFEIAWKNLVDIYGDENMVFPKDIMWLSGAPGAGKGLMTDFIMKTRGITAPPIVTSDLLHSAEAEAIKARGDLVADRHVVQLVLQKLLEPQYASGVIVDGYPRTRVQGECIKLLYDKMQDYRRKYESLPNSPFRRPIFHITVLFVEEDLSVQRQLARGEKVRVHNKTVEETGVGKKKELRKTDVDEALARERYRQFKELIYESLQSIKEKFFFHFISADGPPEVVQERILAELKYQSLFELHELTFEKVRRLPLASEIIENARYELVRRLDSYTREHPQLLDRVIDVLSTDFFPIIRLQALSGKAIIRSENPVFDEKNALNMALDLFTERGYTAVLDFHKRRYPQRVDEDGLVKLRDRRIFEFHIEFPKPTIRHTRHEMTS